LQTKWKHRLVQAIASTSMGRKEDSMCGADGFLSTALFSIKAHVLWKKRGGGGIIEGMATGGFLLTSWLWKGVGEEKGFSRKNQGRPVRGKTASTMLGGAIRPQTRAAGGKEGKRQATPPEIQGDASIEKHDGERAKKGKKSEIDPYGRGLRGVEKKKPARPLRIEGRKDIFFCSWKHSIEKRTQSIEKRGGPHYPLRVPT